MISINEDICIGCGKCAEDCFPGAVRMKKGKPSVHGLVCMECGHCLAVCPVKAVTLNGYDMSEVSELSQINTSVDPDVYLNHLRSRRSIRKFTNEALTEDEVRKIIEAGRYSPTGGNRQNVSYYVSRKNVSGLKNMIYEELKKLGDKAKAEGDKSAVYAGMWLKMYDEYKKNGTDRLFFDAGTVIFISSDSLQSACIAAAHMETMIYSMGLGMLYSGFSERAVLNSESLRKYLQLKDGYSVYAVIVAGHPDVRYLRTVPRKPADIIWD